MKLREWFRTGRAQYVTLWALAVIFVGFALADVSILGLEPLTLSVLATVFAASTAAYKKTSRCETA